MEEIYVGVVIVLVVAYFRFEEAYFQKLSPSLSRAGQQVQKADPAQLEESGRLVFIPPPRANTTAIRYILYKAAYMLCIMLAYLAVVNIEGLQLLIVVMTTKISEISSILGLDSSLIAGNVSVAALAILFVMLLRVSIFRRGEELLRHYFYKHAAIPAQQRLVQSRLRNGEFSIDPAMLEYVRKDLHADGFSVADIEYDETHATRSLWTKISVLIELINRSRSVESYMTAFATICEPSTGNSLVDDVESRYQALKGDAKACLKDLNERPEAEATKLREERFRKECYQLLDNIYRLISLVALRSNFCECDVALCVKRLGFDVEFRPSPLPTLNDLLWLFFILFVVVALPLLQIVGLTWYKALSIEIAYFVSALMPVIIAAEWPTLVRNSKYSLMNIAYPILTGLGAAAIGAVIAIVRHAIELQSFNLMDAVTEYAHTSYPWAALHFVLAGSLAFLLQRGTYPDVEKLSRMKRYQLIGSLRDSIILSALVMATVVFYVYPELLILRPERAEKSWDLIHILPPGVAFIIGFIVPTWCRANANRLEMTWRVKHGKSIPSHGASHGAI